ncbi:MAG: UDP-3-O-(3-hydroxymyristoyl)glucosamine N-acyltransferase [Limisphaerales bacterium]
MKRSFTANQVAEAVGGSVVGDGSIVLTGFAPATGARTGDLTFAENEEFFDHAEQSAAAAILVDGIQRSSAKTLIRVPQARVGFAKALTLFFPEPELPAGVHPSAVVAETAQIDPTAHIGPHCVVGEHVKIGAKVVLESLVSVGNDVSIGAETRIFPNVTIYARTQIGARVRIHAAAAIGSDGFGYVFDQGFHRKIPQVGNVVIKDDAEIGAGVTIDRGALGTTEIGKGAKIDNLVQLGHNVVVGDHCIIVAQAGVAGSSKIGAYTVLAGQVGIAGHLKIGSKVTVVAQSGVMTDIPDGEKWMGSPAHPDRQTKRQLLAMQQLPELLRRVAKLEKELAEAKSEAANAVGKNE